MRRHHEAVNPIVIASAVVAVPYYLALAIGKVKKVVGRGAPKR